MYAEVELEPLSQPISLSLIHAVIAVDMCSHYKYSWEEITVKLFTQTFISRNVQIFRIATLTDFPLLLHALWNIW